MASFKLFDSNGNERNVEITSGMVLGDFVGAGQQGLVDGQVMENSTQLRNGDEVEVIAKSGKAGARITGLESLVSRGEVRYGDNVVFVVAGETLKYFVNPNHLSNRAGDNRKVLTKLGLNGKAFARMFYTEDDCRNGEFPEYNSLASATRIIAALYLVIEAQTPGTHKMTIDGKEMVLSHESYLALKGAFKD